MNWLQVFSKAHKMYKASQSPKKVRKSMKDIVTTAGEIFSEDDSNKMAYMVYKRFGRDEEVAVKAWRRMLQNSCPVDMFYDMAVKGSVMMKECIK